MIQIHIKPEWKTSDVAAIAATILDTNSVEDCLILADALLDAGCDNAWLIRQIRTMAGRSHPWCEYSTMDYGPNREYIFRTRETLCRLAGRPTPAEERQALALARAAAAKTEEERLIAEHCDLVAPIVDRLEARAKVAYAARENSRGYRLRQMAKAIRTPGYVHAQYHDLHGNPPAGHVWIRGATSGKYGRSRMDKKGRPLSPSEVAAYMATYVSQQG